MEFQREVSGVPYLEVPNLINLSGVEVQVGRGNENCRRGGCEPAAYYATLEEKGIRDDDPFMQVVTVARG